MPPTAPELDAGEIAARLSDGLGDGLVETVIARGQVTARVRPDAWVDAARFVKTDDSLRCTFFSWLSAIHWIEADEGLGNSELSDAAEEADAAEPAEPAEPADAAEEAGFQPYPASHEPGTYAQPQGNLFQVLAHASSPMRGVSVTLKTELPEESPKIASIAEVFAGANWHERECHEMFGIEFDGHPDLSRLYLPEDFEGHPLLKSFPLGAREIKPWPGNVDVEAIPPEIEARLDAEFGGGSSGGDSE